MENKLYNKVKPVVKKALKSVGDTVDEVVDSPVTFLGVTYIAATVFVSALTYAGQATIEALVPQEEKVLEDVTLKSLKSTHLPQIKAPIYSGVFAQGNKELTLYDRLQVFEGKFFTNQFIPSMEEGKTYDLSVKGNDRFGWDIVDAEEQ